MTTFGWKRKSGQNVSKNLVQEFSKNAKDISETSSDLAWIQSFKRKKKSLQENCNNESEKFQEAGILFAKNQNFEAAVIEWDKALNLDPKNYKILEMKAQALLQLDSAFLAIQTAEKAIRANSQWWVAYQTLGRSQLAIGDLEMAKRSFSKAIHIDPTIHEVWEEDLNWTLELLKKKASLESQVDNKNKQVNDA